MDKDMRLKQIIEYILEFADEVSKEEASESKYGCLVGCAEALTIIQEQLSEEEKRGYGLDFDIDKKYL